MRTTLSLSLLLTLLTAGCNRTEEPITRPDNNDGVLDVADREAPRENAGAAPGPAMPADQPATAETPPAAGEPRAPDTFAVRLNTTAGPIVMDVTRAWAPHGADRFYRLVQDGFFQDVAFFRVVPGFMAQGGIHGDPAVAGQWRGRRIPDDPVVQSNLRGYVTFAMAGPNTRTTQFFINLVDNQRLDGMGFPPFARVRPESMTVVDQLYGEYGESAPSGRGPQQAQIQSEGNAYLRQGFPELSYIQSAELLPQ